MITPLEIKKTTFKKSLMGGFDVEEVKNYLASLATEFEILQEEYNNLALECEKLKSNLQSYKEMENILHKTLQQAEQTSEEAKNTAKKEAEYTITEAKATAKEIITNAYKDKQKVETEIADLLNRRSDIISQLKLYLNAQVERLKSFESIDLVTPPVKQEVVETAPRNKTSFFDEVLSSENDNNDLINSLLNKIK